jgi:arginase
MHAQLLGFPTALGMPRRVGEAAPAALRRLGLVGALEQVLKVTDLGDVPVEAPARGGRGDALLNQVMAAARRQARAFRAAFAADSLPITLGGDHTTSLGTVIALAELGQSFDVVWLDAHADFNTPRTSPSGNPHGMVLAILAGLTPLLGQAVPPSRLHLWGVRELDPYERPVLEALGVDVQDVPATRAAWPRLLAGLGRNVLLSFDCDCCQPDVAPGTMTPVPGGFERSEALSLVRWISGCRRVLALDVVELHPDRDRDDCTAALACGVIQTAARAQAHFRATAGRAASPENQPARC